MKRLYKIGSDYHMVFDDTTGFLARWGRTEKDDPLYCPVGPEILDVEVVTGPCSGNCPWCYKSNSSYKGGEGFYMPVSTFEAIIDKMPKVLTQVALGITDIKANPELFEIMQVCRSRNVVPNITVNGNGLNPEVVKRMTASLGAVAVSYYDEDTCFNAVEKLSEAGISQVNIHALNAAENFEKNMSLLHKAKTDPRLRNLRAIVFLQLKPKGAKNEMRPVTLEQMKALLTTAQAGGIMVGMDSCSAPMALKLLPEETHPSIEPCESGLFSFYIDTFGRGWPCSFCEDMEHSINMAPFNMLEVQDFTKDVWMNPYMVAWRHRLLSSSSSCNCSVKSSCRSCPVFAVTPCKESA